MAKLTDRAVDAGDLGVTDLSQAVLNENKVFDDTIAILNLEADAELGKPLRIEFNLDQIEDSE